MRPTILILNGPNLNLLGTREPEVYGSATLADIEAASRARAEALGFELEFRQSNAEGQLIDWIQEARSRVAGLIINPAGLGHSSVSLMDALAACRLPVVEVHLSNIHRRESFRHHSYVSLVADAVIVGLRAHGYELAVEAIGRLIRPES